MTIDVGEIAMIKLSNIEVGERARQEMGDLNDIEESMKERGLIQPLAVKRSGDNFFLLAGERRFLILQKNEVDKVPARIYPNDISELEIKSIELAENFYRKNFEYWEYDNLVAETTELQQQIHGVKAPGPGTGWSLKDTAEMMGTTDATVSNAIKRSEAREAFPGLFDKCKTQKDASKVLDKMNEAVIKDVIAKKLEANVQDSSFQKLANSFIVGNFFERVKKIPDGVFHLVEIDPPYSIGLKEKKKKDGESKYELSDYNEVPASIFIDGDSDTTWGGMNTVFKECYRVMVDHSWLICWFGMHPWFEVIYKSIADAGFEVTRLCGIWTKKTGQSMRPDIHLANSYETFFYAWKGRPALNKAGRSNIFDYPSTLPQQKIHPTERPIELMRDIYDTFGFMGSRVLIPFLGSGSGIIAASQLEMSPVGFELSKAYKDSFLIKLHNMRKNK